MIVRFFWPNCNYWKKINDTAPVDAFWVESTEDEAISCVFPLLTLSQVEKSNHLAIRFRKVAKDMGNPNHQYCFLVACDLSSIEPFEPHYPIHQLWNGYSPFRSIPEHRFDDIASIKNIAIKKL